VLALIRPIDKVPKTHLLDSFVPTFNALLAEHNEAHRAWAMPRLPLRVRMVVHAGAVHRDRHGGYGEDLDIAFRLLDAPQTKDA
jgi:hypothetical protein